jgi:hypothetical protein
MTQIVQDSKDFAIYRYGITAKYVPPGAGEDDTIHMNGNVVELRVIKDYEKQALPYVRATALLTQREVDKVRSSWKDGRMFLTVKKYKAPPGSRPEAGGEEDTGKPYLENVEFRIMMADGTPGPAQVGEEKAPATDTPSVRFPMELAPVNAMEINKVVRSHVFHDVRMNDVMVALTNENAPKGADYKFAMSPAENDREYESIFIPPLDFVKSIRYLDEAHGIYKGRLTVFLDSSRGYLTGSTKTLKTKNPDDPQAVSLETLPASSGGPNSTNGSGYDKDTKTIRLRTGTKMRVDSSGLARSEAGGRSVQLIGSSLKDHASIDCKSWGIDDLLSLIGGLTGAASGGTEKEKVMWKTYDNPLVADRMKIMARESYSPAAVELDSFDVDALEPTLPWRVLSGHKSGEAAEGNWKLQASEVVFTKPPGTASKSSVAGTIRLVPASDAT